MGTCYVARIAMQHIQRSQSGFSPVCLLVWGISVSLSYGYCPCLGAVGGGEVV